MNDERTNPFERGQLKREAIDWWVRMHDANADVDQREFKRWLERGALHRAVYNRVSQVYGAGKMVDWDAVPPDRHVRGTVRRSGLAVAGALMLCGFIAWRLVLTPILMMSATSPIVSDRKPSSEQVQLLTRLGEMRQIRLADGSRLTLDTDTLVTVDFRRDEREVRLEHGRARFDVAHELRPFAVDAGETQVVAHGTIFDVSFWEDRTAHVHLLRGSVVVEKPMPAQPSRPLELAELHPGEGVTFPTRMFRPARIMPAIEPVTDWPGGSIDFAAATLGEVIDTANRYSATKIDVAYPKLRNIPVSGVFRVNDPQKLATSLALLFALRVTSGQGKIVLNRPTK